MSVKFKYLFSPLKIGPVIIPNRIMLTGHANAHVETPLEGPTAPGEHLAYYQAERAKGGCGLICYGYISVCPFENADSKFHRARLGGARILGAYPAGPDPKVIPAFKRLVDMCHPYGTKVFAQIGASGVWEGRWGPSKTVDPEDPRKSNAEMTEEQIEAVLEGYRLTAQNAVKAGFDGIEIHDHGGMVHNFMSPLTNRRKDKWGGSLDNRLRFLYEAIKRCREGMNSDMALITRLCVDEFIPGGIGVQDGIEVSKRLEDKVDGLNLDIGIEPTSLNVIVAPLFMEPGYQLYGAEAVKEVVKKIPIGCVGRINDPVFAEKILVDGKADFIGICRGQIADPEFANKAKAGRLDDIRPCIYENEGCFKSGAVQCTVNPTCGVEKYLGIGTITSAEKKKKILSCWSWPCRIRIRQNCNYQRS